MCSPKHIRSQTPQLEVRVDNGIEKPRVTSEQRKEVRFDEVVHCRRFRKYSSSESENVWFSQYDQDQAVQEIRDTIDFIDHGIVLDGSKCTSRGLERYDHAEQRLKRRRQIIEVVIDEQYRQWDEDGTLDDDQISAVYQNLTQSAKLEAQVLAARDRNEVDTILREDSNGQHTKAHRNVLMKNHHQECHTKRSPPTSGQPVHFGTRAA